MSPLDLTDHWSQRATWWCIWSAIFVFATSGLFALLLGAWHRALARSERAATASLDRPLQVGARFVAGKVVSAGEVISVRLVQRGTEGGVSGAVRHTWTEQSRDVVTHPFVIETDTGERVGVNASHDVRFCHDLRVERIGPTERALVGALGHGDRVTVAGRLVRTSGASAYRTADAPPWQFEPPRIGAMLVSTLPLAEKAAHRATLLTRYGVVLLALTLAPIGMAWEQSDWERSGERATAEVVSVAEHTGECRVDYRYEWSEGQWGTRTIRIDAPTCGAVGPGTRLWVTARGTSVQLGTEPGIEGELAYVLGLFAALLIFGATKTYRETFAWYERKRFRQSGPGSLA